MKKRGKEEIFNVLWETNIILKKRGGGQKNKCFDNIHPWNISVTLFRMIKFILIYNNKSTNKKKPTRVYIIKIIYIFAPPPCFKMIFSPPSTPLFVHLLHLRFEFFPNKSSYIFPQPTNKSYLQIYTPVTNHSINRPTLHWRVDQ